MRFGIIFVRLKLSSRYGMSAIASELVSSGSRVDVRPLAVFSVNILAMIFFLAQLKMFLFFMKKKSHR